ncbi:hypothetical protein G6F32_016653 [Rhizopus arrhizus]|nr:hypothetical protein G6F32_016653 [Rhizopus arrhizus]
MSNWPCWRSTGTSPSSPGRAPDLPRSWRAAVVARRRLALVVGEAVATVDTGQVAVLQQLQHEVAAEFAMDEDAAVAQAGA